MLAADTAAARDERRRFALGRSWKAMVRRVETKLREAEASPAGAPPA
jgi:hypothetical protein